MWETEKKEEKKDKNLKYQINKLVCCHIYYFTRFFNFSKNCVIGPT